MTDQIADLLARIRNASAVSKYGINIQYSKTKEAILNILLSEGFVKNIIVNEEKGKKSLQFEISDTNTPTHLKQISKPGQRIYVKHNNIPRPLRGFGLIIISTPKGMIKGKEAQKFGVGGELICEIW